MILPSYDNKRIQALYRGKRNDRALGLGKWVTSVTSAIYYLLLFYIWKSWYGISGHIFSEALIWTLALLRIGLCSLLRNQWSGEGASKSWGIIRNLPFIGMGIQIIILYLAALTNSGDAAFQWIPLAVLLSFGCYLPVVIWGKRKPAIGMLMMPKTLLYIWIQMMGVFALM